MKVVQLILGDSCVVKVLVSQVAKLLLVPGELSRHIFWMTVQSWHLFLIHNTSFLSLTHLCKFFVTRRTCTNKWSFTLRIAMRKQHCSILISNIVDQDSVGFSVIEKLISVLLKCLAWTIWGVQNEVSLLQLRMLSWKTWNTIVVPPVFVCSPVIYLCEGIDQYRDRSVLNVCM